MDENTPDRLAPVGEVLVPYKESYWNPHGVPGWKKPIARASASVVALPIALWLGGQFFQLRGYVSVAASRWFLYFATAIVVFAAWGLASTLPKWRKTVAFVVTLCIVLGATVIDTKTVPKRDTDKTATVEKGGTVSTIDPSRSTPTTAPTTSQPATATTKKSAPNKKKSSVPEPTAATHPTDPQPGSGGQTCINTTLTNCGPNFGTQTFGSATKPNRTLNPDDIIKAVELLKQADRGTSIFFITYPTQAKEGGEISNFEGELENVFSQGGWQPYLERNIHLGNFRSMGERSSSEGEGIGCSLPDHPTPASEVAIKALSLLHYPCTHPSVSQPQETQGQQSGFALYVSVGTRIEPEQ